MNGCTISVWKCSPFLYFLFSIEMNHQSESLGSCFPLHFSKHFVRSFHASLYFQIIIDFHFHGYYTVVALWIHRISVYPFQKLLFAKGLNILKKPIRRKYFNAIGGGEIPSQCRIQEQSCAKGVVYLAIVPLSIAAH